MNRQLRRLAAVQNHTKPLSLAERVQRAEQIATFCARALERHGLIAADEKAGMTITEPKKSFWDSLRRRLATGSTRS